MKKIIALAALVFSCHAMADGDFEQGILGKTINLGGGSIYTGFVTVVGYKPIGFATIALALKPISAWSNGGYSPDDGINYVSLNCSNQTYEYVDSSDVKDMDIDGKNLPHMSQIAYQSGGHAKWGQDPTDIGSTAFPADEGHEGNAKKLFGYACNFARKIDEANNPDTEQSSSTSNVHPSFDCSKASNRIEKSICASPKLSRFDNQLTSRYKNVMRHADNNGAARLKHQQISWIRARNKACNPSTNIDECLTSQYQDRLQALQ